MTQHIGPCTVAILAGGMGTRLRARTGNLPKPMAPVLGRPVLEHLISLCRRHGFTDIALLVHYEHEVIRAHFGDGERFGVRLRYCIEADARGTAGALRDALGELADRFLVLYGDTYADVDLSKLWSAHARARPHGTLLLHPNDHPQDSDLVALDTSSHIAALHAYPHPEGTPLANMVNAALYVLERHTLHSVIPETGRHDLAKHTFPAMLARGDRLLGYVTPEYIKDMGTPERLDKVERDIIVGLPEKLSGRQPRRAVFIDRDGTINVEMNHLREPNQLQLEPGAGEAVRLLNRSGTLAVCVTNQPVVARGDVTLEGLASIHARMDHLLGEAHAYLDALYFCPHHPDRGFPGEVETLKICCDCRKPATGLIDRAVNELYISRRDSWMVGDTTSDLRAGRRAGLRTILVRTGHAGRDAKYDDSPDYVMPDLQAAVDWVLRGHAKASQMVLPALRAALDSRLILVGGPARAGKTSISQVLAEQLVHLGKTVHVLSLDGWLYPVHQRPEGVGVLERYAMNEVVEQLTLLQASTARVEFEVPVYDRCLRSSPNHRRTSVGPDDVVVVEGVTALLDERLISLSDLRLYIDTPDDVRKDRLRIDYAWRATTSEGIDSRLAQREIDEVPIVRSSAAQAHFCFQGL